MSTSPFTENDPVDPDREIVERAQSGSREALEQLVSRHQTWIYNVVLRMLYLPQDAEDATQEILIKLVTKLSTFKGESRFRTWLYRIVVNHVLTMKRTRGEAMEWTFEKYGGGLNAAPDEELPDQRSVPADLQLIVEEAKIGCTSGMLLCLSREQRLVYILGEIFGVTDVVGAELLEISRESFRQKLSRARRDLHQFMHGQCGLVNASNPCRCAKKTQAFIKAGYLDPANLLFAATRLERIHDVAPTTHRDLEELDAAYAGIYREHPFQSGPDFVASLRNLMSGASFKKALFAVLLAALVATAGCASDAGADRFSAAEIVALERGALDRWGKGDPKGYYEIMASEETYFDPTTAKRIDGFAALKAHIAPFDGKIAIDHYEIIDPKLQHEGNVAVLTFNLVDSGARIAGVDQGTQRWNSTEVFQRIDGKWKIVHSHWSYVKPGAK